jgi:hypothetical protein
MLLEKLRHHPDGNDAPRVDESTSLEVLSALYQVRRLDGLGEQFAELLVMFSHVCNLTSVVVPSRKLTRVLSDKGS